MGPQLTCPDASFPPRLSSSKLRLPSCPLSLQGHQDGTLASPTPISPALAESRHQLPTMGSCWQVQPGTTRALPHTVPMLCSHSLSRIGDMGLMHASFPTSGGWHGTDNTRHTLCGFHQ